MTLRSSVFHDTIFQAWMSFARRGPRLSRRPVCDRCGRCRDVLFGDWWTYTSAARLHFGSSFALWQLVCDSAARLHLGSSYGSLHFGSSWVALGVGSSWGVLNIGSLWVLEHGTMEMMRFMRRRGSWGAIVCSVFLHWGEKIGDFYFVYYPNLRVG